MSTISASTTSTTGFKVTSDTTGTLVFQTGASPTTAMTLGSDQSVTFAGAQTYTGAATFTTGISVQGLTVGKGAGAVSTNTAVGASALAANTTGADTTAIGAGALQTASTAVSNTAIGKNALNATTGSYNTGVGHGSMATNTSGTNNAALGFYSLLSNTTGAANTAIGREALQANTTASYNTAVGYQAAYTTNGGQITAIGYQSNLNNTGYGNTSLGYQSLYTSGGGYTNSAIGRQSLYSLTSGISNTAIGNGSGYYMTTGSNNTILGSFSGNQGGLDIRTASNYIVLSDGDGNPRIVHKGSTGNLYLFSISSGAGTNAARYNTSTGEFTFDTSSARYKDNIRDSIYGLSHVMQMRSAQFEYKDSGRSDVGLIAEELDLIVPELVGKNADNQPDSVSYDRMVSVLVKAIQELKAEFDAYKEAHP